MASVYTGPHVDLPSFIAGCKKLILISGTEDRPGSVMEHQECQPLR